MPLIRSLSPAIQRKVRRCHCQVVFKSQALVIPIGKLNLKVGIVPGCTPFLLSNTFMRALKALIDTANHKLLSPCLRKELSLHLTRNGLYLVDINQLATLAEAVKDTEVRETYTQVGDETPTVSKTSELVTAKGEEDQPKLSDDKKSSFVIVTIFYSQPTIVSVKLFAHEPTTFFDFILQAVVKCETACTQSKNFDCKHFPRKVNPIFLWRVNLCWIWSK